MLQKIINQLNYSSSLTLLSFNCKTEISQPATIFWPIFIFRPVSGCTHTGLFLELLHATLALTPATMRLCDLASYAVMLSSCNTLDSTCNQSIFPLVDLLNPVDAACLNGFLVFPTKYRTQSRGTNTNCSNNYK